MRTIIFIVLLLPVSIVDGKDYKCADINSIDTFKYGKFEAYIKIAYKSGTVSSFFLIKKESWKSDVSWQEIDFEMFGKNPYTWQSNIITGYPPKVDTGNTHDLDFDLSMDYHLYTIEWTPDCISWYIDNIEYRRDTVGQVDSCYSPMEIHFSLWPPDFPEWAGNFDDSKLPVFQYIDWVKYSAYTPGEGDNGSDFTLEWIDEFDTFQSNRWAKSEYVSEFNLADVRPENGFVEGSNLILKLEKISTASTSINTNVKPMFAYNKTHGRIFLSNFPPDNYYVELISLTGNIIYRELIKYVNNIYEISILPGYNSLLVLRVYNAKFNFSSVLHNY